MGFLEIISRSLKCISKLEVRIDLTQVIKGWDGVKGSSRFQSQCGQKKKNKTKQLRIKKVEVRVDRLNLV